MPLDVTLVRTWKYLAEGYPLAVDFTKRLRTGQNVTGGTVTAEDITGVDVSAGMLGTVGYVDPKVVVVLKANFGIVGQLYYLRFVATTAEDSLEQIVELEIRNR